MCGWVGVFGAQETEAALRKAPETLASRAPDGFGEHVFHEGPLAGGLAHLRLDILDPTPAGAEPPMRDAELGTCAAYNGQIYHTPENTP